MKQQKQIAFRLFGIIFKKVGAFAKGARDQGFKYSRIQGVKDARS
jgi:hypothetical protein